MDEWVEVAQAGDIPEGQVKVVEAKGQRLALAHVGDGYFAVEDLCTHDEGPLGEGELFGGEIECPRHGARFDVKTGRAMTLPAVVPVKTFPVKVVGTKIMVQLLSFRDQQKEEKG